ncbi:voltage-gated potassium channel [Malonomonas rubra DSM 5091]|uniref:Voltage-gated potassium channel n=1 Tax=Malonomonas rubra DSM 5091 TaxID=1122189 RepID=A0A1M6JWV7_MALRU|nr:potassium channel protein [Malonomonas rubra]SHJ51154.1 voltage-gated potassium channel [Malonomonas rubra DSM 5091]
MDPLRKVLLSLLTLFILIGGGTAGYVIIEDWATFEALYMTVITLATVGYKEVYDLSYEGKVFTIVLIVTGTGTLAYTIGSMFQFMVEGQLRRVLGRKKLQKQISNLKDHYIICGYGRIGRMVCQEFSAKPLPFIVVEQEPERCQQLEEAGILFVQGDATNDDVLEKAGIREAKGLITVVTSDSANVFITLTARGINPDLFILARASEDSAQVKLMRAGANKVISPYKIGASRIAQAILRPSVVDFIEIAIGANNIELQMEEIQVNAASRLVGKNLIDSGIRKNLGLIIVGIKKNQQMMFNPDPGVTIDADDILIALGKSPDIKKLEKIALNG